MAPSNTAIRLSALVLVATLGLTLLPSVALADTTDTTNADAAEVCTGVQDRVSEASHARDHVSRSDGTDALSEQFLRAATPAEGAVTTASHDAPHGWLKDVGVSTSPAEAASGASDADSSASPREVAHHEAFRGITLRDVSGTEGASDPASPTAPAPLLFLLVGAGASAAMLRARRGPWTEGGLSRPADGLVPPTALLASGLASLRGAARLVSEQGRGLTGEVVEHARAAPVGGAGDHLSASSGNHPSEEGSSDLTIDEVDLLPDDAYVESILDDNGGRMKQSQIVSATDWSKAKVSRLLSTMDDDGQIVKIQIGRENLICLEGEEPDIMNGSRDS